MGTFPSCFGSSLEAESKAWICPGCWRCCPEPCGASGPVQVRYGEQSCPAHPWVNPSCPARPHPRSWRRAHHLSLVVPGPCPWPLHPRLTVLADLSPWCPLGVSDERVTWSWLQGKRNPTSQGDKPHVPEGQTPRPCAVCPAAVAGKHGPVVWCPPRGAGADNGALMISSQ